MKRLLFSLLLLPVLGLSQNTLEISVKGVESSKGNISVALYNTEDTFLEFDKVFRGERVPAKKGETKLNIADVPEGEYAVAVFHDENANKELDVNWMGIPKETVGFSNAKMKTFGPPSFKECAFTVNSDRTISVQL